MIWLLGLTIKLAAQLVLIAWWGCQLAVWHTRRAARTLHARHVRYRQLNRIGDTAHDQPQATPRLDHEPFVGDWQRDAIASLQHRTAVDLARAVQQDARARRSAA